MQSARFQCWKEPFHVPEIMGPESIDGKNSDDYSSMKNSGIPSD
jgi:hypothetical protein